LHFGVNEANVENTMYFSAGKHQKYI